MTIAELIDRWLRDCTRKGCKPSTMRVYEQRVKTIVAELGPHEVTEITRLEWLDWIDHETHWPENHKDAAKRSQRKSNDTVRLILTTVKMIEEFALDRELIVHPWHKKRDLKKPPGRRRERLPTPEETAHILAAAQPDFRLIYRALMLTGARPGELCAARIEQILDCRRRRTLVLSEHKTAAKTGADRKIPIGADVAPIVDEAIAGRTSGHIFLRADSKPWTREAVTNTFRAIRRRLGLPDELKLYACTRHLFATAVTSKHGIARAKALLGHSSITTTQRYDHPSDEEIHNAQSGLFEAESPELRDESQDKAA